MDIQRPVSIGQRTAPHPPVDRDWQALLTEGHVWIARLNTLIPRTAFITSCVFLFLFNHDIISSTSMLSARLNDYKTEPAGWVEKLVLAPFSLIKGAVTDTPEQMMQKSPAPKLNSSKVSSGIGQAALAQYVQLQKADREAMNSIIQKMREDGGRNETSWKQLVETELEALNKTQKLAPGIPLAGLAAASESWYSDIAASESPVSKTGKDGAVWIGAVIVDKAENKIKPVFGVFRQLDNKYTFFNVRPSSQFYELKGFPTVALSDIPRQSAADFPDLVAPPEKAGALRDIQSAQQTTTDANAPGENNSNTGPTQVRVHPSSPVPDFRSQSGR